MRSWIFINKKKVILFFWNSRVLAKFIAAGLEQSSLVKSCSSHCFPIYKAISLLYHHIIQLLHKCIFSLRYLYLYRFLFLTAPTKSHTSWSYTVHGWSRLYTSCCIPTFLPCSFLFVWLMVVNILISNSLYPLNIFGIILFFFYSVIKYQKIFF